MGCTTYSSIHFGYITTSTTYIRYRTARLYYSTRQKHFWQKAPRHSCTAVHLYENCCSADAAESTRNKLSRRMSARIA
eukprot:COSAG01_NODE_802_length_13465_cov_24.092242_11_plen_78_part_00